MNIQKWEYKILGRAYELNEVMQDRLNKLGNEGWELVAITPSGSFTLKRPLINISKNTENLNNNASNVKDIINLYQ